MKERIKMKYTDLVKGKRYKASCLDPMNEEDSGVFYFVFLGYAGKTIDALLLDDINEKEERYKTYLKAILDVYVPADNAQFFDDVYELDHDYYEGLVIWDINDDGSITTCTGYHIQGFEEYPYWKDEVDKMYKEYSERLDTSMLDVTSALELGFKAAFRLAVERNPEILN
jgi:hypothetical protein